MSLKISSRLIQDVVILDLKGRITLGEGSVLLRDSVKSILAEGKRKVLLNVADVAYIDSSGVGELSSALARIRMLGGDLKLLSLSQKVHDLLQITKFYSAFDVYDNEKKAIESFGAPELRCCCPLCGEASGPPVVATPRIYWPPQGCRNTRCEATFVAVSPRSERQAIARNVRIQTYKDEHFELLSGPPFIVKIVGRLDLFSSSALKKSWQAIPVPRRILFDLSATTEIADAGRDALLDLLAKQEKGARTVVSLEGLDSAQGRTLPSGSPFYRTKELALAALGDVSDTPPLRIRVLSE